ncbi:MAG: hypothetical protein KDA37_13395, partial [Planctomycetales bacterium]|nr:hypothetical protein [Planctomycetales bacterium]
KPEDRYQTAGAVSAALTEWLAERGRKPGGGKLAAGSEGSGSGIGSGVLGRFGLSPSGSNITNPSSGGLASPTRDTEKLSGSDTGPMTDDDLELAPLDEEKEEAKSKTKKKPASSPQSSGVLSDDSSPSAQSRSSASSPSAKRKSIFEEEFAEQDERAEVVRKSIERSEYNPLHPPGYKNPYNRNTWVIWLLAAVGVLVVGGVILVNLLR